MTWNRSKQETLSLPIYAVALLIPDDYTSDQECNWRYGIRASRSSGPAVRIARGGLEVVTTGGRDT
jgi:hypothetical protein